jgi:pseudouridylate synthase
VFATGGIGGVHREPGYDESADLIELARSPLVVVCAGAKSILDLPATMERLETLGVLVVGYRTWELPGFLSVETGIRLTARVESAGEIARLFRAQESIGRRAALLVALPPPADRAIPRDELDAVRARAAQLAAAAGISGAALTPYLLAAIREELGGRAIEVNLAVLERDASLAAEVAAELLANPGDVPRAAHGASGTKEARR